MEYGLNMEILGCNGFVCGRCDIILEQLRLAMECECGMMVFFAMNFEMFEISGGFIGLRLF